MQNLNNQSVKFLQSENHQFSAKPICLQPNFEKIHAELAAKPCWILWDYRKQNDKYTKVPLAPSGLFPANVTDDRMAVGFQEVASEYWRYIEQGRVSGIGFILSDKDNFIGLDCDKCVLSYENKKPVLNDSGKQFFKFWQEHGAYIELSPSGKGLRGFIRGRLPSRMKRRAEVNGSVWEIYENKRFLTVTGLAIHSQRIILEVNDEVLENYSKFMGVRNEHQSARPLNIEYNTTLSKADLSRLKQIRSDDQKLDDLLSGELVDFPSQSEADLSLCSILASIYQDPAKVHLIWKEHGPWRLKCENRPEYVQNTIKVAFKNQLTLEHAFGDTAFVSENNSNSKDFLITRNKGGITVLDGIDQLRAAEAFIQFQNGNLLCVGSRFYRYAETLGIWQEVRENAMEADLLEFLQTHTKIYPANRVITHHRIKDLLGVLSVNKSIYREELKHEWNCQENLIVLANGVLDLNAMQLIEYSREHFSTFRSPVAYQPNADCSTWKKFLKQVVPNQNDRIRLAEWSGYFLLNDCRLEKALLLYGSGANGKSTFIETITALFDQSEISRVDPCGFGDAMNLAELDNKRLNVVTDIATSKRTSEIFKQIVSGEPVTARRIYSSPFIFRPKLKMLLSSNNLLQSHDRSDGFMRRWDVLEFKQKISAQNINLALKDELRQELSGILNWALQGLQNLRRNQWKMTEAPGFQDGHNELRQSIDIVNLFIESEYEISKPTNSLFEQESYVRWEKLKDRYTLFCKRSNFKPLNATNLKQELKRLGHPQVQRRIGNYTGNGHQAVYVILHLKENELANSNMWTASM